MQGEVEVYSRHGESDPVETEHPSTFICKTNPGSRIQKQAREGKIGKHVTTLIGDMETFSLIGDGCVLLNTLSPFTYIAKTRCVMLVMDSTKLSKNIMTQT